MATGKQCTQTRCEDSMSCPTYRHDRSLPQGRTRVYGTRRRRKRAAVKRLMQGAALLAVGALLIGPFSTVLHRLVGIIVPNAASTMLQFEEDEKRWSLTLVNAANPLPEDFQVSTTTIDGEHRVDARIADQLNALLDDCRRAGYNPRIRSSFRTREEQQQILDDRIMEYKSDGYSDEDALAAALQWVALPGTSEHELGLAVDINDEQYDERMYSWLAENAHRYGFILRYPPDKEAITGISNEPWHFRYVGIEAATEMYGTGEVLEDYLDA